MAAQNDLQRARHLQRGIENDQSADAGAIENKKKELEETKTSRPTLFAYAPALMVALLKDLLDLVGIGSLPAIGTVITICFSLLIFLLLLLTRANHKLIDARFIIRMGVILLLGSIVEGFAFGLNFLPIETIVILIIYLMDKHFNDEQIEKITAALQLLHKRTGKGRSVRGLAREARQARAEERAAQQETTVSQMQMTSQQSMGSGTGAAPSLPPRMMDGTRAHPAQVHERAANDPEYGEQRAVFGSDIAPIRPSTQTALQSPFGRASAPITALTSSMSVAPITSNTASSETPTSETSYKSTFKALSDKLSQEQNHEEKENLKQEMANGTAGHLASLTNEETPVFINEFNRNFPGMLKGQEFRLMRSHGETLVFVDEAGSLKERTVTKENAKEALLEIKKQDETLRGKSYELRRELVKRSEGDIITHEAYTYAVDIPQGSDIDAFLDNQENWIPERNALHQEIVDTEYAKAIALSKRLEDSEPTIYALRGNTAAGKTTAVRNNELFKKALDQKGQPSGAINPDTYKNELRTSDAVDGRQSVGHQQTHEEGSMLARKISNKISQSESSMVIDKRMNKAKNISELIKTAEKDGKTVKILDVDVPLEASLIRVLGRKAGGEDPLVPFGAVAEGFEGIRKNRRALLKEVIKNPKIKDYVLYAADESGVSVKVAEKANGKFTVLEGQKEALKRVLDQGKDTESIIAQMGGTVINEEYIQKILANTSADRQASTRASLEQYSGKTLKDALDTHAQKLNES